jgi:outer membrane immunogenic protein
LAVRQLKISVLNLLVLLSSAFAVSAEEWSGFHIGARINGAFGDMAHVHQNRPNGTGIGDESLNFDVSDVGFGGFVGYRTQTGPLIFGGELGYDYLHISGGMDIAATAGPWPPNPTWNRRREMDIDHLFTLAAQVGREYEGIFVYGKGGVAFANVRTFGANVTAVPNIFGDVSDWEAGWLIGVGAERKLQHDIFLGIEYNYIGIRGDDRVIPCVNSGCNVGFADVKADIHKIDLRISRRF